MKKLSVFLMLIFILHLTGLTLTACKGEEEQPHTHVLDYNSGFCTLCDEPVSPTLGVEYQVSEDGTYAEVVGFTGSSKKVNIADKFNDLPVKHIKDNAFYICTSLMSVIIPASITSIGDSAFYNCDSLGSVTFGKNSQLISMASYSFYDCDMLTSIVIPADVTSIGEYAFFGCDLLTSAEFENPNGWWYSNSPTATSGTDIPSESLSNKSTAAGCLSSMYFWKRT